LQWSQKGNPPGPSRPICNWHLNKVVIVIRDFKQGLWNMIDYQAVEIATLMHLRRHKQARQRFFRNPFKQYTLRRGSLTGITGV